MPMVQWMVIWIGITRFIMYQREKNTLNQKYDQDKTKSSSSRMQDKREKEQQRIR